MKILLVSPPFEAEWRDPGINHNSHYPLGIAYIHSYLETKGHIVETHALNSHTYSDADELIRERLSTFKPQVVGLNMLTSNRVSCFALIEHIQKNHSDIRVVIGGIHASDMYEQIVQRYPGIVAVIGEGEIVFGNLLTAFESGADLGGIKGIAYVEDSAESGQHVVKVTPREALIEDLDILPFPKHELFFHEGRTVASILTSRGCPFQCSYCVLGVVSNRRVRYRSIENVMSEIEYLVTKYPQIDTFWIHDDVFFIKPKRAIEFCDEFVKRNIKRKIICSGRFKPFSKELAEALDRAGCEMMMFGLETGSRKLMETSHKSMKPEDILHTFSLLKDAKVIPVSFLIVGLPGEDDDTVSETIAFVKKMQKIRYFHFSDIGILTIYPGTEVYEIAKAKNFIDDSYWLGDGPAPLYAAEHGIEQLHIYKNRILDALALERIFTFRGFIAQVDMIPYVLKSLLRSGPHQRLVIISLLIKAMSPFAYLKLKSMYLWAKTSSKKYKLPRAGKENEKSVLQSPISQNADKTPPDPRSEESCATRQRLVHIPVKVIPHNKSSQES